jgi:CubicO group peptidase (beta-lactamase class C family)
MKVDPEAAGLDERRLERITDHLQRRYIEPGKVAGCQALVARHGQVAYFRSFGHRDRERALPVQDDTIWRIYSMTKPVTGIALMTLYEQGHFQLDDPLHKFLPELRGLQVKERADDGSTRLVDPHRPVSVRDVLMHTAGFGYEALVRDLTQIGTEGGRPTSGLNLAGGSTLADLITELASRPLHFHPGSKWLYSVSIDVCARLVEVLSGQRFDEYLQAALFDPLRMTDTGFSVPDADIDRFAALYRRGSNKELKLADDPTTSSYRRQPSFLMGGGGLVSTTGDYLRFCQMLLNGGELDGVRVLSRKTVELIRQNHLAGGTGSLAEMATGFGEVGFGGLGFGLSMAVGLGPVATGVVGSPGFYTWGGAASTIFWIDPAEDVLGIFMTQFMPSGTFDFRTQLQILTYSAIVD